MENKGTIDVAEQAPETSSCWKKSNAENATFMDQIEEFFKTPMEQHKVCFTNAWKRMIEKSKTAAQKYTGAE